MTSKVTHIFELPSTNYLVLPKVGAGESPVSLCLAVTNLRSLSQTMTGDKTHFGHVRGIELEGDAGDLGQNKRQ